MTIRFKSCESVIGAKVEGVSLRQLPDEATIEVVEDGLEHYGVLIFRDEHSALRADLSIPGPLSRASWLCG